jgi:hypothetical protein
MAIFTGAVWIVGTLCAHETYAPFLLRSKAASLSKLKGMHYVSKTEATHGRLGPKRAFGKALSRPWILLFREPIVLLLSIYVAVSQQGITHRGSY